MTEQEKQRLERIKKETKLYTEQYLSGRIFNQEIIMNINDFNFLIELAERNNQQLRIGAKVKTNKAYFDKYKTTVYGVVEAVLYNNAAVRITKQEGELADPMFDNKQAHFILGHLELCDPESEVKDWVKEAKQFLEYGTREELIEHLKKCRINLKGDAECLNPKNHLRESY